MIDLDEAVRRLSIAFCHHGRLPKGSRSFSFPGFALEMEMQRERRHVLRLIKVRCIPQGGDPFCAGFNFYAAAGFVVAHYLGAARADLLERVIADIEDDAAAIEATAA